MSLPALSLASSILRSFSGKSNASRMSERATEKCKKKYKSYAVALLPIPGLCSGPVRPMFIGGSLESP